jgi:hypothetical protein
MSYFALLSAAKGMLMASITYVVCSDVTKVVDCGCL